MGMHLHKLTKALSSKVLLVTIYIHTYVGATSSCPYVVQKVIIKIQDDVRMCVCTYVHMYVFMVIIHPLQMLSNYNGANICKNMMPKFSAQNTCKLQ